MCIDTFYNILIQKLNHLRHKLLQKVFHRKWQKWVPPHHLPWDLCNPNGILIVGHVLQLQFSEFRMFEWPSTTVKYFTRVKAQVLGKSEHALEGTRVLSFVIESNEVPTIRVLFRPILCPPLLPISILESRWRKASTQAWFGEGSLDPKHLEGCPLIPNSHKSGFLCLHVVSLFTRFPLPFIWHKSSSRWVRYGPKMVHEKALVGGMIRERFEIKAKVWVEFQEQQRVIYLHGYSWNGFPFVWSNLAQDAPN